MGEELKLYSFKWKEIAFLRKLKLNFKSFDVSFFFGASLYYKNGKEFLLDAYLNSFKFCSTWVWIKLALLLKG